MGDTCKHRYTSTPNVFFRVSTALVGLGLLYEVIRLYLDTPHSVGLLSTSDRPVSETSKTHNTHKR
jgi:hypothetical protein